MNLLSVRNVLHLIVLYLQKRIVFFKLIIFFAGIFFLQGSFPRVAISISRNLLKDWENTQKTLYDHLKMNILNIRRDSSHSLHSFEILENVSQF